jgi:phosphopantetheine adenylyltransferase
VTKPSGTLFCGITGDALLKNKKYSDFIEPYEVRKGRVEQLLKRLAPSLKIEFFELLGVAGIAGDMEDMEACVLTKET